MMKIEKAIYEEIVQKCPEVPPETGGILGGKNGIVCAFEFDRGKQDLLDMQHRYIPDVARLNQCILKWEKQGIEFMGIVHSHIAAGRFLSRGDEKYIKTILRVMPPDITELYFPIVLPKCEMIAFAAMRMQNDVNIVPDNIRIID